MRAVARPSASGSGSFGGSSTNKTTTNKTSTSSTSPSASSLLAAKAWFFLGGASGAVLFPFIPVFLESRGLSPAQIGLISALRPWVAAPATVGAAALADARRAHRPLLLLGLAASAALRAGLPLAQGPAQLCGALLAAEAFGFFGVLGDATVLSNLGPQEPRAPAAAGSGGTAGAGAGATGQQQQRQGDGSSQGGSTGGNGGGGASYGAQRVWASVGWGVFGVAGGAAIRAYGIERAPFAGFGALSAALLAVGACMSYNYGDGGGGGGTGGGTGGGGGGSDGKAAPLAAEAAAGPAPAAAAAEAGGGAAMRALLRRPDVAVFLFQATALGFGMGVCQVAAFALVIRETKNGRVSWARPRCAVLSAPSPASASASQTTWPIYTRKHLQRPPLHIHQGLRVPLPQGARRRRGADGAVPARDDARG